MVAAQNPECKTVIHPLDLPGTPMKYSVLYSEYEGPFSIFLKLS